MCLLICWCRIHHSSFVRQRIQNLPHRSVRLRSQAPQRHSGRHLSQALLRRSGCPKMALTRTMIATLPGSSRIAVEASAAVAGMNTASANKPITASLIWKFIARIYFRCSSDPSVCFP